MGNLHPASSAASRVHLSRPTRLGSPGYGLSSAPTRDKCTRDGAELAGCKSPTAAALSPLLEAKLASGATLDGSAGHPFSRRRRREVHATTLP